MQQVETGTLAGIELLRACEEPELKRLEGRCKWRRYKAGEQIVDHHSTSRDVFFVVEGRVEIVNYSISGRAVAYGNVRAGGYFGELAAIDGEERSASVVAAENCLVAFVPPDDFLEIVVAHSDIALIVMRRLAGIIRVCNDRIMDLSTLGAVQRVCIELLRLAEPDPVSPDLWAIYPMPTQHEVAARASTTRETVARVVGQLTQAGLISRKGKSVYIRDRDRLEVLAERLGPGYEAH